MLSKYGKLLLGAYILKKFISEDSNQVSEQKTNGIMSRCGKLILAPICKLAKVRKALRNQRA